MQAKYAYRAIAEFVKHVTEPVSESQPQPVFPELKVEPNVPKEPESIPKDTIPSRISNGLKSLSVPLTGGSDKSSSSVYESNKAATKEQTQEHPSLSKLAHFSDSEESLVENTLVKSNPFCSPIRV